MDKKYKYSNFSIEELYINPENYRYVDDAEDEIDAIIFMFKVPNGDPKKEMYTLAQDIVSDGLNPFEMPIVCYDEDLKKYIVYDGNRRLTCIKLMTQYKDNKKIAESIPFVLEIYKLMYQNGDEIQCVVYDDPEDAKRALNKIHQDLNEGIGRKQWDYYAKMKATAANGNVSKAYAIIDFMRTNPNVNPELVQMMVTKRWTSKLERVVGFSKFKDAYNISFDNNCKMIYADNKDQVLVMLEKLVYDLMNNSATDNFRFRDDFNNYIASLDEKYKTQVTNINGKCGVGTSEGKNKEHTEDTTTAPSEPSVQTGGSTTADKSMGGGVPIDTGVKETRKNLSGTGTPKSISRQHAAGKEALRLSKEYSDDDYLCLNEKGKQMLAELESLNIKEYPVAASALCRCLVEYTAKLWLDAVDGKFDSRSLASTYSGCLNTLRKKKIIDHNEHSVLITLINKENFITLLNTWMHADTDSCVSETPLVSGWKNTRLLIEKYVDIHKKRD